MGLLMIPTPGRLSPSSLTMVSMQHAPAAVLEGVVAPSPRRKDGGHPTPRTHSTPPPLTPPYLRQGLRSGGGFVAAGEQPPRPTTLHTTTTTAHLHQHNTFTITVVASVADAAANATAVADNSDNNDDNSTDNQPG